MKIYVVEHYVDYEGISKVTLFSTKELAEAFVERDLDRYANSYEIQEQEVDPYYAGQSRMEA